MKKAILTVTLTALLAATAYAAMGQILASWPSPKYPNTITVNGIAFEGDYIWLKNDSCEETGVLKCTKMGSLVKEIAFPFWHWNDSSGLAYDGEYLWTIHHQFQWPRWDFYTKYTTNGSTVSYFQIHGYPLYGSSQSVSWDGQYLWTDERLSTVKAGKYTTAGSLLGTFAMPPGWGTAGAYYNHQIWAGGNNNYIYGMNIAGALVGSFPAPGGSVRAVGFDGEYLWTGDANKPQYFYKVDIDVVDVEPGSFGKIKGIYR
jgi:hypothetical protein